MNRALQQSGRYSEQNFSAIPRPGTPLVQNTQLQEITAFERCRAIQSQENLQAGLIMLLHTPDQETMQGQLQPESYLQALLTEIELVCKHLPGQPVLQQLHAYGDTALFSPQQLQQLFTALKRHLQLPTNNFAWFSIGINPGNSSWASLGKLRDAGFNRITLSCNEPGFQAIESLYEAARALQFNTITMRARYRQDGSGEASVHLQEMVRLQPDRIVLEHDSGALYDEAPDATLTAALLQAGYVQVANSCFVLPDDELTEHSSGGLADLHPATTSWPVLGLGAGASSQLDNLYYCNDADLEQYVLKLNDNQLPPARGCKL